MEVEEIKPMKPDNILRGLVVVAFLLLLTAAVILGGCVRISGDPATGEFSYSRWGDQKISGFEYSKNADGTYTIKFDQEQSEGKALGEITRALDALSKAMLMQ